MVLFFFIMSLLTISILSGILFTALARRRAAFMGMWQEMQPLIQAEVGLTYEEMVALV